MKHAYCFFLFSVCLVSLSCKKKHKPVDPVIPDVYVAVSEYASKFGRYCKNGEVIALSNDHEYTHTRGVFVSGNDVYAIGQASLRNNLAGRIVGQLWKNGSVSTLENGISSKELFDIVVSQGDVYVSGEGYNSMENLEATYWKNGKAVFLAEANQKPSNARGIFVAGKDVYVAGSLTDPNNTAVYWKNGTITRLGDPAQTSSANAVAVSGQDVYVVGSETHHGHFRARYWKNGVGTFLTGDTESDSEVADIAVLGKDVYCVGKVYHRGDTVDVTVWKNGVPQVLPRGVNATSIFLFNNDVYVAGEDQGGAMYWKNGESFTLPGHWTSSIFVKNP